MGREQQQYRGRGRFAPRGGRTSQGGGRSSQRAGTRSQGPQLAQKEIKFTPHMQGKPQSATYATVKDAIISQVQKTFKNGDDIAQSIKDGKVIDLKKEEPIRLISVESDARKASLEQTGFDIKYQEELRRFLDRKDNLRQGLTKAYALILSNYCNKVMQSRVKEHPDFDTKIENDPIVLLESIKVLMHDPIRAQYPMG